MKISVNARLTTGHNTGIAHYVSSLYAHWPDKKNLVLLRQSAGKLGGLFKAFWFDNFIVGFLAQGDIFHGPANILPMVKKRGIKYVVTIHDLAFLTVPQSCSFIFRLYYRWAVRRSVNQADLIIAISRNTKKDLQRFYKISASKIRVIYPGVDEIFFRRQKRGPLVKSKYIFSVATHAKRKNISITFQLLAEEPLLKDYKLVVSGPILDIAVPQELKSRVILTGFVNQKDLANFYQNAEFFIYPSYYEGFGFPVLEAMACRCPVITSNNSSLVEVTPDKKWLVDPHSLEDISNKVAQLIKLTYPKREKLIERNYSFCKKFTWEKTTLKFKKIINNI